MVHVGVDLHKSDSQLTVREGDGKMRRARLNNGVDTVRKFYGELEPGTLVAMEASGSWWWLVDELEHLGHEPVSRTRSRPRRSPRRG